MSENPEKPGTAKKVPTQKLIDFTPRTLMEALQWVVASSLKQVEFTCKSDRNKKVLIYPSGRFVFFTRVRYQGHRYRVELGKLYENTLEQIHQNYLTALQRNAQGLDPRVIRRKKKTYGQFFEEDYLVQCRGRGKKSLNTDISRYTHWLEPVFGPCLLTEIDATMASRLMIRMRESGLAPATIHKTIGTLKTVLNVAVEMDLLPKNPLAHIKPPPAHNRRTEFLTVADLSGFVQAAKACTGDEFVGSRALLLTALTGSRIGETLNAKFDDFDLEAGLWKLPDQKSGKPGVIHLSLAARAVVAEMTAMRVNDYLFCGQRKNPQLSRPIKLFRRLCKHVGLGEKWRIHDLRHGWCSAAISAGTPIEIVSHAARHSSPVVTRIYSHPHQEQIRAANENVARLIAGGKAA